MTYTEYENKQSELNSLMSALTSSASDIGDWKVAKYQEYLLAGITAPYDIQELHTKRQAVRDRINVLRNALATAVVEQEVANETPIPPLPESQFDVPVVVEDTYALGS